jgi:hypothetical protein
VHTPFSIRTLALPASGTERPKRGLLSFFLVKESYFSQPDPSFISSFFFSFSLPFPFTSVSPSLFSARLTFTTLFSPLRPCQSFIFAVNQFPTSSSSLTKKTNTFFLSACCAVHVHQTDQNRFPSPKHRNEPLHESLHRILPLITKSKLLHSQPTVHSNESHAHKLFAPIRNAETASTSQIVSCSTVGKDT